MNRSILRPPRRNKRGRLWSLLLVLLAIAAGAVTAFWPGGRGSPIEVDVRDGASAHQVARSLAAAGVVQSRYPFLVWIRVRGAGDRLQVGRYRIARGRSAFWIADDMIAGRTLKVRVAIPEGFASWQIGERLQESGVCDGGSFRRLVMEKGWEGFLFPATYDFDVGMNPAAVANRMRSEFDRRWTPDKEARAAAVGLGRKEAVTLASIIEREVRVPGEHPLVAAVYHNRLKRSMRLDADPTVQYAQGFWNPRLTYADYRNTRSPYNTYLSTGLPPGPICSPGDASLTAALWPADSDALFFVATESGAHEFSATYREHVNKVNRRNRRTRGR